MAVGPPTGNDSTSVAAVLASVLAIELADVPVGDQGDGDFAAQAGRGEAGQPAGQSAIGDRAAAAVGHRHDDAATVGIHRTIRTP